MCLLSCVLTLFQTFASVFKPREKNILFNVPFDLFLIVAIAYKKTRDNTSGNERGSRET